MRVFLEKKAKTGYKLSILSSYALFITFSSNAESEQDIKKIYALILNLLANRKPDSLQKEINNQFSMIKTNTNALTNLPHVIRSAFLLFCDKINSINEIE